MTNALLIDYPVEEINLPGEETLGELPKEKIRYEVETLLEGRDEFGDKVIVIKGLSTLVKDSVKHRNVGGRR